MSAEKIEEIRNAIDALARELDDASDADSLETLRDVLQDTIDGDLSDMIEGYDD